MRALRDELLRNIAGNVRRVRLRLDLTHAQLAERASLSINFVSRIELGRVNLSIATLAALAQALQVLPAALLRTSRLPTAVAGRPRAPRAKR